MHKCKSWLILPFILFASSHFSYSQESKLDSPKNTFQTYNDYLFSSIDSANYQLVSYLLIKGANPNYRNDLDLTPLMVASMNRDTNITILLLKKGARINDKNLRGENALQWAIMGRQPAQAKLLVNHKSEINIVDEKGISPLFYALGYSAYDLTSYLNEDYRKVFEVITSYTTTKDLLEILVNAGVDINQVNAFDCTPLLFATFQNDAALLRVLCKLGANPNKPTQEGITPLIYATQDGFYGIVEQLLKNGAEVNHKLPDGNTALFAAVKANNDSIAEQLIQSKASVNEKNSFGLSPLHYASGYGFPYMVNLLVNAGAAINAEDLHGNTPLMTAVYSGAKEVTNILVNSGADVNIADSKGNTPLMVATQFNDTALIKKLYLHHADINRVNNNRVNSLSIAIESNSVEAFKLLSALGAKTDDSSLTKSYYQQAIEVGSNEISTFLASGGQKTRLKPNIRGINIYTGFTSSESGFMVDFGGGIYEPITKMLINVGYKYRSVKDSSVIISNSTNNSLLEERYSVYLSFQHLILLKRDNLKGNVGFTPGLSNEFTWQYYQGFKESSSMKWTPVPSFGLYYQKSLFTIIGKWEVKYNNRTSLSNRFNLQVMLTIPTGNRVVNKRIGWLDK